MNRSLREVNGDPEAVYCKNNKYQIRNRIGDSADCVFFEGRLQRFQHHGEYRNNENGAQQLAINNHLVKKKGTQTLHNTGKAERFLSCHHFKQTFSFAFR